jgi:hypothetical protein
MTMSKRNRTTWLTISRRRRTQPAAPRFIARRAPALKGLMAATALSCSFLAFVAPNSARAQDVDTTGGVYQSWFNNGGGWIGQSFFAGGNYLDAFSFWGETDNNNAGAPFTFSIWEYDSGTGTFGDRLYEQTLAGGLFGSHAGSAISDYRQWNFDTNLSMTSGGEYAWRLDLSSSHWDIPFVSDTIPGEAIGYGSYYSYVDLVFRADFGGAAITPGPCADGGSGADICTIDADTVISGVTDAGGGVDTIELSTASGDLTFDGSTVGTNFLNFEQIQTTGSGQVTLTNNVDLTVVVDGGSLQLDGSITPTDSDGVHLNADGTSVTIGADGSIDAGGVGVFGAQADLTFTSDGSIVSAGDGVHFEGGGTVDNSGGYIRSNGGAGIYISAGGGTVNTGQVFAAFDGVYVDARDTAEDITIVVDGTVTSVNGDAVVAHADGGDITITVNAAVSGDPGIVASNTGSGDVILPINADVSGTDGGVQVTLENGLADIDVANNATIDGTNGGAGAFGISVTATGGTIDIDGAAGTSILADTVGIYARTTDASAGVIDIDWQGTIAAGDTGIRASNASAGGVHVSTGAASSIDAGAYGVNVTAAGGLIDIDVAGSIGATTRPIIGVNAENTGAGGTIDVTIDGNVYASSMGVFTHTTGAGADSQVTVTGRVDAPFGITSRAYGAGDSDVSIDVSGMVTGGTNGIYGAVRNAAGTGLVDLDLTGSVAVTGNAVWARNDGTGGITVTTGAASDISGTAANGIIANAIGGGAVSVTTGGTIGSALNEVSGNGVYARSASGSITIDNGANIFADQFGIYTPQFGSASVDITNSGDITVGRTGIRAFSNTGAVTVTNAATGTVTVDGTNPNTSSMAVYALTNGALSIYNDGQITVTSSDGNIVAGVRAIAAGYVNIESAGDITLTALNPSNSAHGIVVGGPNDGVRLVAEGDIVVHAAGNNFAAINITSAYGFDVNVRAAYFEVSGNANGAGIQVNATGAVTVDVDEGHVSGFNAEAIVVYGANGPVSITAGELTTSGGDSQGILVGGGGTGAVTVVADSVTTDGAGSHGIEVNTTGHIDITATDVTTLSGGAHGIVANGDAAGVEIETVAGGLLSTSGDGIYATTLGSAGAVSVNSAADILAGGDGIEARSTSGNLTVTTTGAIDAAGWGVIATSYGANTTGTVDVTIGGAGVTASNSGVFARSYNGDTTVTVNAAVNGDVMGVAARANSGDVTLNINADVNGDADAAGAGTGVYARMDSDGVIDINIASGVTVTGAAGGWGVYARSGGGDIVVDLDGAIAEGGLYARGFSLYDDDLINLNLNGSVTNTGGDAVHARSDAGLLTIALTSGSLSGSANGVFAQGGVDGVSITTAVGTSVTGGTNGIYAQTLGTTGGISITTNGDVTGVSGDGIIARADGGDISITTNGTVTGDPGIVATNTGSGNITEVINNDVSGTNGAVFASAEAGLITIDVNNVGTVLDGTNGGIGAFGIAATVTTGNILVTGEAGTAILADTTGIYGRASGVTGAGTAIDINWQGDITAGGRAVDASTLDGSLSVVLGGTVTGGTDGVVAAAGGAGSVFVQTDGAVSAANGHGIDASSINGAVTIYANGTVDAVGGAGILGLAGGSGSLYIRAADTVTGGNYGIYGMTGSGQLTIVAADVSGDAGISARSVSGGPVDITVNGTVTADTGTGVSMVSLGAGSANDVQLNMSGSIVAALDGVFGYADGVSADVYVYTNGSALTIDAGRHGIYATTVGTADDGIHIRGDISITAVNSGIIAAVMNADGTDTIDIDVTAVTAGDDGINASNLGLSGVNITVAGLVDAGQDGIEAYAAVGSVSVTTNGAVDADGAFGINASSGAGSVTVNANAAVTGDTGIQAASYGAGTVSIYTQGAVTGATGMGVGGYSVDGDVNIGGASGLGGPITAAGDGVYAYTAGAGNIVIRTSAAGDILAGGNGVVGYAGGTGGVTIETYGQVGSALDAVGGMGIYATVFSAAAINITAHDDIFADGRGIFGFGYGGDVNITTTEGADVTSGGDWAVRGNGVLGDGNVTISLDGSLTSAGGGVSGLAFGLGNVTITTDDAGDTIDANGGDGVNVYTENGAILVTLAGDVDASGAGVYAYSAGGASTQVISSASITAGGDGVLAISDDVVDVNVGGSITAGGYGVYAVSDAAGYVHVTVADVTAGLDGVFAQSAGGDVIVDALGDITSSTGDAIHARNTTGDITVTTTAGTTLTAAAGDGIDAASTSGNITVVSNAAIVADPGILLSTGGAGVINLDSFGAITANNGGIVTSTAAGLNQVDVYGTVEGDADDDGTGAAVEASSTGGQVNVFTHAGGDIVGNNASGIVAVNTGATAYGVHVNTLGEIGSAGLLVDGSGITANVTAAGSTGQVLVEAYAAIFAGGEGIGALNAGSGDVVVLTGANADIVAGDNGVLAWSTGTGDVTVTTDGTLTAANDGIDARIFNGASTGLVSVTANDAIVAGPGSRGIWTQNYGLGGIVVTTGAAGDISGVAYGGIVAVAAGGGVTIHNDGDIGSALDSVGAQGVFVLHGAGGGDVLVDGAGAIFAGGAGIDARNDSVDGDVTVNLTAATADIVAGANGINVVSSATGDTDLTVFTNGTITTAASGISASTATGSTGDITLTANAAIDAPFFGIFAANNGTGATVITTGADGDISGAAAFGIVANTRGGDSTVHNNGDIGSAGDPVSANGIALTAYSGSGTLLVDGAGAIFAAEGIGATMQGSGDIVINLTAASADIVASQAGINAAATSTGDSDITVFTNGTVSAGTTGIRATITNAANTGDIVITANDAIDGALASQGIYALTAGNGAVTVTTGAAGDISGNANVGIHAQSAGGAITVTSNGDIGSAGNAVTGNGIRAVHGSGAGDVVVSATGAIFAGAQGVDARSSSAGGDITVTLSATADIVAGGSGVYALANGTGDSDVTVTSDAAISAGFNGIDARITNAANTGTITVTANDAITGALAQWGVLAFNTGTGNTIVTTSAAADISGNAYGGIQAVASGGVTVHNNGDIGSAGNAVTNDGVRARNNAGTGDILIDGSGAIFAGGRGIDALNFANGGDVTVNLTSAGADIVSGGQGIRASALGAGDGDVTVFMNGTITSGGHGIYGYVFTGGTGTITVTANDLIDASGNGIRGLNYGAGGITINQAAAADISGNATTGISAQGQGGAIVIHNNGDIGSAANTVTLDGVLANQFGTAANGTILIDGVGAIFAGDDGIEARVGANSTGSDVTITLTSAAADITAGDDGISVTVAAAGDSDVSILTNGTITTTTGDGVDARITNAANTGTLSVTTNDAVSAGAQGVAAINLGSGGVTVVANGAITSGSHGLYGVAAGGLLDLRSYADITATTGDGIHAVNTTGDIHIYTAAGQTITAAAGDGIDASTTGGSVFVESRSDIVADPGILIVTGGAGNINVQSFGAITANDGGIVTSSQSGYNHVYAYNTIEGDADNDGVGDAINATSNGGDVLVYTSAAADIIGNNEDGIFAANTGATANGVTVIQFGDIGSAGTPVDGDGIDAFITNAGSTGNVGVSAYAVIFAGSDGVYAFNAGSGATSVTTSAAADIVAGADGVRAISSGAGDTDVTVVTAGTISAGQDGIDARITNAASTGTISVTANDAITGALSGWGVRANNAGTGGTVVITGAAGDISGNAYGGVYATAAGGGVTVSNAGDVGASGNAVTNDGIRAINGTTFGNVLVNGSGAIFAGAEGVDARNYSLNGDVTVTLPASADIVAGGNGINAWVFGGGSADVTVTTSGTITSVGHGIYGFSSGGTTVMTITANDVIDATANGIRAINGGTGGVTINQAATGDITGNATFGIVASGAGGNVTVHNNGDIGSAGNRVSFDGVYAALTGGSGTVLVDGIGPIFAGDDGIDARVSSAGADISIQLTNAAADIVATDDGVYALASSTGDSDITVLMNGTITGTGDGVEANITNAANTGTVSITVNDLVDVSGGTSWGTRVNNAGTGGITIVTAAAGDITGNAFGGHLLNAGGGTVSVSGAGDIGSSGNAVTNDGVRVTGSADLISMTGTGGVFAGDDGFDLNTSAAGGDITVNLPSTAIIRATDDGIYASATGTGDSDVTITFAGSIITTSGNGVDARITNAANTGTLIVNANASVTSGGTAAAINTVNNGVAVSSTTTINIASGVIITGGTVSGASYAIDSDGGPTTINNAGTINGFVNLTDSADTVNNTGLWNALGTSGSASLFGLGTDTVNNQANARIEIAPASVAATTVTWTGLEAFNNNGGVVDLRQGHTGDVFSMLGTTFTGSNVLASTSRLQIDATLSFPLTADRMNIGAAAGVTTVQLVDLTPAQPGALDLTGVIVVDATSGPSTAFTLEGGPIDKGFVEYNLVFDPANFDWRLMGLPSAEAFEMLKLGQASQSFWRHSADTWTARMQEVRDAQGQASPTRSEGWEMWAQAHMGGEEIESRPTYTFGIATLTPNLDNDTSWRGFQMGADKLVGNAMYGITGGFQQQETDFSADNNGLDLEGWNLGAYAGWNSGGAFVNGLVKADWYSIDVNMRTAPAMAHVNAWTWGAKAEAGFRFGGPGFFVEPVADVAYTDTSLDDAVFPAFAASFRYRDTVSLRAQAGVRVGGIWGSIAPFAGVYAGEEFEGENDMTMFTGPGCPSCMTIQDQPIGSFGKAEYGFNILNLGGLEGFLKGETLFGGDASGTNVKLGVRWRW